MEMTNTSKLIKAIQENGGALNPNQVVEFSKVTYTEEMNKAITKAVIVEYGEDASDFDFNTEEDIEEKALALVSYLNEYYNGVSPLTTLEEYQQANALAMYINDMDIE